MSSATQAVPPLPTMYDMTKAEPSVSGLLFASRSTAPKPFTSLNLPRVAPPGAAPAHGLNTTTTFITTAAPVKTRSTTRSISDLLDDIFYTYTGVASWAAFSQVQRDGAALRQQLQRGAVFEHAAVQPAIPPSLLEWTRRMRAVQAGRVCAVPATAAAVRGARRSTARSCSSRPCKCPPYALSAVGTASVGAAAADAVSPAERELDRVEADGPDVAEDGLLPVWDDLAPTQRCGPAVLRTLRAAVRTYYRAILALVSLAEQFVGRWGHLSPAELRELQAAMAREKAAHVPAGFLFSAFVELNASEERLDTTAGELAKYDNMTVLRLNGNPALAELDTLPPKCRAMMACGCRLRSFLRSQPPTTVAAAAKAAVASPLPQTYAALTTLGLAYNELHDVKFISLLPSLVVLDASFNFMVDLEGVVRDVAAHDALAEVTFVGNPFSLLDTYRTTIVRGCLRLEKLDKVAINSEELALSYQRSQIGERGEELTTEASELGPGDAGMPATTAAAAAAGQAARKTGHGKAAVSKLTLPAMAGGKESGEEGAAEAGPTGRPRKPSQRKHSALFAASQITLTGAAMYDGAAPSLTAITSDEALRTTVAAEVELLVLRGLGSFESTVQARTIEELLPTATLVYELAGVDGAHRTQSPLSRGVSVAGFGGAATPGQPANTAAAAVTPSPLPTAAGSRKEKGGGPATATVAAAAATAASAAGATAGGGSDGAAGGHGRLGNSPGQRSNTGGSGLVNGKRVAAAPPLYELTSRICIEGYWGGGGSSGGGIGGGEDHGMSHSRSDAPPSAKGGSMASSGVHVDFSVELASPAPSTPHRGGARHGPAGRPISTDTASRQRKKVGAAGGVAAPSAGGVSAAAGGGGGNAVSGGGGGGTSSSVQDPYILSGAAADGTLGRRSSLSSTGVYAAQLPLTPDLVAGLQQPLVLRVVVEDTFRFVEGAALRALTEVNGARGNSAARAGGAPGSAGGARGTRDCATPSPTRHTPTVSMSTSPLPEAALLSVLGLGPRGKRDAGEGAEDAVVECQRREIGIIRLNPFDLLKSGDGSSNNSNGVLPQRAAPASAGLAPTTVTFPPTTTSTTAGGGLAPSSSSSSSALPQSRVLFLHAAAMEVNASTVQAMQAEVQQWQRQLQDALHAYHVFCEQCAEPAAARAMSGGEGRLGVRDSVLELVAPSTIGDGFSSGGGGQVSPRSGRRGISPPSGVPFLPTLPTTNATTSTPAQLLSKPLSRSSRVSTTPQSNAHLLHLHLGLKELQAGVVRLAVRVMALEARLRELTAATLSADARFSLGRGPPPPLTTNADAELDSLRYRREAPATRKGRPQPPKAGRRGP